MKTKKKTKTALPYVIVRTYSAGCFAGELVRRTGKRETTEPPRGASERDAGWCR